MEEKQGLKWSAIGAIISYLLSMTIIYITYRIPMVEAVSGVIGFFPLVILPLVSAVIFKWKCSEWPLYFVVTSALEIMLLIVTYPIVIEFVVVYHNEMSGWAYGLLLIGMIFACIITMAVGGVIAIVRKIKGVAKTKLSTELNFENDTEKSDDKLNVPTFLKIVKEY